MKSSKPRLMLNNVRHISEKYFLIENNENIEIFNKSFEKVMSINFELVLRKKNGNYIAHLIKIVNDVLIVYNFDDNINQMDNIDCFHINNKKITKLTNHYYKSSDDFSKIKIHHIKAYDIHDSQNIYLNNHLITLSDKPDSEILSKIYSLNSNIGNDCPQYKNNKINIYIDGNKLDYCLLNINTNENKLYLLPENKIAYYTGCQKNKNSYVIYNL